MKIAVLIIRILFGGLMVFSSLNYFFQFLPMAMPEGEAQKFTVGMAAAVYMFPLIKVIELIAGLAILTGYFIPMAAIVMFPISLNIFLFHLFLAPDGTAIGLFILAANLFFAYHYRSYYRSLFDPAVNVSQKPSGKLVETN